MYIYQKKILYIYISFFFSELGITIASDLCLNQVFLYVLSVFFKELKKHTQ